MSRAEVAFLLLGGVEIRTNNWLKTMDNKRMIYADVYGDLLKAQFNEYGEKQRVLGVVSETQ